jgi:hypothetical protein
VRSTAHPVDTQVRPAAITDSKIPPPRAVSAFPKGSRAPANVLDPTISQTAPPSALNLDDLPPPPPL